MINTEFLKLILRHVIRRVRIELKFLSVTIFSLGLGMGVFNSASLFTLDILVPNYTYNDIESLWQITLSSSQNSSLSIPEIHMSDSLVFKLAESKIPGIEFSYVKPESANLKLYYKNKLNLKIDKDNQQIRIDRVGTNFWHFLNVDLELGTIPLYYESQVAVSYKFAKKYSSNITDIIGIELEVNKQIFIVSAVMSDDFESPTSTKLNDIISMRTSIFSPTIFDLSKLDINRKSTILLLAYSKTNKAKIKNLITDEINREFQNFGSTQSLQVKVQSFNDYKNGKNNSLAIFLMSTTSILFIISIFSSIVLMASRLQRNRIELNIRNVLGCTNLLGILPELVEFFIISTGTFIISLIVLIFTSSWISNETNSSFVNDTNFITFQLYFMLIFTFFFISMNLYVLIKPYLRNKKLAFQNQGIASLGYQSKGLQTNKLLLSANVFSSTILAVFAITLIHSTWINWEHSLRILGGDRSNLEIEFETSARIPMKTEILEKILTTLQKLPEVKNISYSNANPVDLLGDLRGYSGPYLRNFNMPNISNQGKGITQLEGNFEEVSELSYFISVVWVTPDYFELMDISAISGEIFDASMSKVVVLSESASSIFFSNINKAPGSFIPGIMNTQNNSSLSSLVEVLGVVKDMQIINEDLVATQILGSLPVVYIPLEDGINSLVISANASFTLGHSNIESLSQKIFSKIFSQYQEEIRAWRYYSLKDEIASKLQQQKTTFAMATLMGLISLLLVVIGTGGLAEYQILMRKKEIGIRLALGSKPLNIASLFLNEFSGVVLYTLSITVMLILILDFIASNLFGQIFVSKIVLLIVPFIIILLMLISASVEFFSTINKTLSELLR